MCTDLEKVLLSRNVKRFRGGLVVKAHGLLYHSTLGLRVIKKKKRRQDEILMCTDLEKVPRTPNPTGIPRS